jgi:hypothetical protein
LHPRPETHPSGRLRVCPIIWFSSGSPQQAGFRSAYPVIFSHQRCNRRLSSGQPELASPNKTLGPKSCCGAPSLFRQRGGGFECCCWHLKFGLLFTRPADQPRHATSVFSNPVDPGSPPGSGFGIESPSVRHDRRARCSYQIIRQAHQKSSGRPGNS